MLVGRAALLLALVAATNFGWLLVNRCGMCVITLDPGLAIMGVLAGGLGALGRGGKVCIVRSAYQVISAMPIG